MKTSILAASLLFLSLSACGGATETVVDPLPVIRVALDGGVLTSDTREQQSRQAGA